MGAEPKKSIKVFYCYAHEDKALRDELERHLGALERLGQITGWYDRDIQAGTEWKREIEAQLNTSGIILLLISADFIHSDYCYSIEMQKALELHRTGRARVIPIILRPVYWQGTPIAQLQVLPSEGKPVSSSSWHSRDEAFYDVVQGIHAVLKSLLAQLSETAGQENVEKQQPELQEQGSGKETGVKKLRLPSQRTSEEWRIEGNTLYHTEHYNEALACYEEALHLKPDSALAHYYKGNVLTHLKRYDEALAAYRQAVRFNSNSAENYHSLGDTLLTLENYSGALAAYEQAIRLNPSSAASHHHKGIVLQHMGRLREAQRSYNKAKELGY